MVIFGTSIVLFDSAIISSKGFGLGAAGAGAAGGAGGAGAAATGAGGVTRGAGRPSGARGAAGACWPGWTGGGSTVGPAAGAALGLNRSPTKRLTRPGMLRALSSISLWLGVNSLLILRTTAMS